MDNQISLELDEIIKFTNELKDKNIVSLEEKIKFGLSYNSNDKIIEFVDNGVVTRTITLTKFIGLCQSIIENRSFALNDIGVDVTDFEVTLAYHFLYKQDQSIKGYKRENNNLLIPKNNIQRHVDEELLFDEGEAGSAVFLADSLAEVYSGSKDDNIELAANKYEVAVNYVTNRKETKDKRKYFTGDRDNITHYGSAVVRIPESHESGIVERPKLWKLQLSEDPSKHITIKTLSPLEQSDFMKQIQAEAQSSQQAIVFVHGFNVSFKDSVFKAAQLKFDLGFEGPMILFSWPSKASVLRYTHDITNAEHASGPLKDVLAELTGSGINEVFLIAHSMGTRCLTLALKDLAINGASPNNLESLVLAAPDIDSTHFKDNIAGYITPLIKTGAIYLSDTDVALTASKVINGYTRLGDVGVNIPVFNVIDTIDASDKGGGILKHSYITEDNRVIDDLYHFLFNKQPPKKRRLLDKLNGDNKIYWKFA